MTNFGFFPILIGCCACILNAHLAGFFLTVRGACLNLRREVLAGGGYAGQRADQYIGGSRVKGNCLSAALCGSTLPLGIL